MLNKILRRLNSIVVLQFHQEKYLEILKERRGKIIDKI